MKRFCSFLMSLVLVVNMFIFMGDELAVKAQAATTNQLNIVARADYMYNSTWVCQKTIYGWNYKYTFYKGNTYHLPYAWPVHAGAYIGYGISTENFLAAAADVNNAFYKYRSYVSGVSYSYSTYYGSDCSSFVSWCWGIKRNTTYTIPNYSTYIGSVSTYNATHILQLGDALNSQDHVVLVTDLQYNSSGAITQIEITEQTPPQMKRSYYTPAALSAKYGGSYSIYRYYGTVPAAPYSKPTLPNAPVNIGDSFTATISNVNADMNVAVNSENNVVIMDKAVDTAQQWRFSRRTDGSYEIKNVKTGKCLDVAASGSTAGSNVHVWDDLDNAAQSWYVYYVDGNYALRPGCTTDCVLDVAGSGTTSGTNVATWTYNACDAQMFTISHVLPTEIVDLGDSFTAKITNVGSGKNLSIYEPNNVVLYHDSTSPAQQWKFVRQTDGSYEITNLKYGTCLDVSGGSGETGANVQLWEDINSKAQRWFIYDAGDNYVLRPACSFDCVLDVEGGFSDDNTNIQTWSYNSGSAQKFTIKKLASRNGYEAGYAGGIAGDGKIYAHGLDLSSWQGTGVDFNAIRAAGYSYVILRAGTTKGKDTCFETLYTNAKAAGLNVGAYYYSYATTVEQAAKDAQNMLTWVQGKMFEYPLYFDYEDASQNNLSAETSKNICLTFMDRLANAGYLTGIYTGYYKSTTLPMSAICARYESWIANYYDYTYQTLSPSYSARYGMYQYTDRNYVNGAGPFDGNVAFKDYPSIVKQYGFNGYASPVTEEVPVLDTTPVDLGSDFYAKITNVGAGKNLSIYEPNNAVIYQPSTSPAQEWHFVRQSDGSYEITNVKYNKCLDVEWGKGNAGDNVDIWEDLDNTAQRWFIYSSGASYVLQPACSEKCVLDVAGSATENDSNVIIWTYNGCNAQRFTINQILPREIVDLGDSFTAKITNASSGKNLSIYEPDNVVIYQNSTSPAQQWKFVRQSDGSYEITNVKYGLCMDVYDGRSTGGTNVRIWEDNDSTAQRWFIYSVNGHYVLRPACASDCVLDVQGGNDADDTNVQTWTYHAGEPELFDIRKISADDYADIGDSFTAFITNVNADKNLDIGGENNVVIFTQGADASQKWDFVRQTDGSYEIKNARYGLYLEVAGAQSGTGANVQLGTGKVVSARRWYVYALESGQYILKPACTVDCVLDVAGSGTEDNANMETWTYNGSGAQLFRITMTVPGTPEDLGESFLAKITNVSSGKNVSIEGTSNVAQYENTANAAQLWQFVRQDDGSYQLTNLRFGQCMEVENASGENDANVQLGAASNSAGQRWFVYKMNDNYILRPACSDNCMLDVDWASDENYANIQTWNFNGGDAQQFRIKKIDTEEVADLGKSFVARITNVNADKNLSIYEPNNVILYQKSDSKAQWWRFEQQMDGSYEIINIKYGQRLDVQGGLGNAGVNVEIWEDLDNTAQRWFIYEALDGKYVLRPACSENCVLDVAGSGIENDTNIQIWTYIGANAQLFTFSNVECTHAWTNATCTTPKTCSVCGITEGDVAGHAYENGSCTVCGGADPDYVEPIGKFDIAFAQVELGNALNMRFAFPADAQEDWSGAYAVATKTYADGREDAVQTVYATDWESVSIKGTAHYAFTFSNIAGKEMSDEIYITIYNADGEAISNTYVDSIQSYIMRNLEKQNDETKTMMVDMLNYGSAAQTYYGYGIDDLANARLTEDQRAYGSDTLAECKDSRVKGDNYQGTRLELKSSIVMQMAFSGLTADMSVKIEFTNHSGTLISEIVAPVETVSGYVVAIDQMVVADGRQPISVTVYNPDGTVYGTATDSLASYLARMGTDTELYEKIMMFSDSTYNYLH